MRCQSYAGRVKDRDVYHTGACALFLSWVEEWERNYPHRKAKPTYYCLEEITLAV
jgi:hypothetical protein